ncbi:hypothetical protein SAMN02745225_00846 [Ferrithrix thermotolerans DSM 19514]|jgi:hypothetical protein|uniref:Uncharacterized protein n=1 Tax=Ferrithrix thermotolerans DSM 19514 TaxID=1121881 RepID=A0A1M4U5D4_9ACTN|nr:hypothetical protein [Ferrithrix thermotolerans]SHE51747.1 hypothetical protein SAMN02745225_00846 [Ferrithrix thermotolerans DSM 19514]
MNGYVEAGYAAVTAGLGSYAIWLSVKSRRLREAFVRVKVDDEAPKQGE